MNSARGRYLVIGIVGLAVVLGLVALKFRRAPVSPTTAPSTLPSAR